MNDPSRSQLLKLARTSINYYLNNHRYYVLEDLEDPGLLEERAIFVTLHKAGELRGCIGHMLARMPLYKAVIEMAAAAAFDDPRFPSLLEEELDKIKIEISILSPMSRIYDYRKICLGTDGVLIRKGFQSGVYLPQVASETGWDLDTFLQSLCASKAGLPAEAYKDADTEISVFQVDKFSE
ncbi:MAG: AmmeMemoRadiSam system protein A [Candidatus Tenebribacter davisii]|jgi:AmmeMemoRadiSam system protein A|nr:AmmeMemoRadiSam system protein A [Candidatus Tenebribacter davisii]